MKHLPKRKRLRLKDYDYSSENFYFVTICTKNRKQIFGMADNLSLFGHIAENHLKKLNSFYNEINVIKYIIMPNHIHAVISVGCNPETVTDEKTARKNPCPTLSDIIGSYKAGVTREIHNISPGYCVWQQDFYDHIIKNEADFDNVWIYIEENPAKWENDEYY